MYIQDRLYDKIKKRDEEEDYERNKTLCTMETYE